MSLAGPRRGQKTRRRRGFEAFLIDTDDELGCICGEGMPCDCTTATRFPPNEERAMCSKCDDLRREIAHNRGLSLGLTDPAEISLNKDELRTLEKKLDELDTQHLQERKPSSQARYS